MPTKSKYTLSSLEDIAREVRVDIVQMLYAAGSGHTGGALGIADVMTALYFKVLNIDPADPGKPDRDRFILSAGHMVPVLYAVLAERGFLLKSELSSLREFGSRLKGHNQRNLDIGIENTAGSLGQGIGIAVGLALAAKQDKSRWRTYCLIGDGESNEGAVWEAAMLGAKYKLDNLCVICDRNNIQLSNTSDEIMPLEPLADKWKAFGWHVLEIDGNDMTQVLFSFEKAKLLRDKPTLLLARTTPGKGVSFMENKWEWHGRVPKGQELKQALDELTS